MPPTTNSYDELPYESHPFPQTHPDRLATVATLLGLTPAPVDRCRVLELGCASGGNLIPMALGLPGSTFLGVDLSERQVAAGRETIAALGLANVELRNLSILDIAPELGQFDYIIAHGVYSWVPPAVQDKILAVCHDNLAPGGIAYVSYNTLPGWHMRGMIRDMMCYHANHFTDPLTRVQQGRSLLDFLAESVAEEKNPYSVLLQTEVEHLRRAADYYLFHEHLEDVNEPIYFYQFAERAEKHGLRFLGEAELHVMVAGNYPAKVAQVLQMLSPDVIHLEQYMDFLRNRMFRQSLLCRRDASPAYLLRPEQLAAFAVASPARPVNAAPDLHSAATEQFQNKAGVTLSSSAPIVKAAMLCLADAWPHAVPFADLCAQARARLTADAGDAAARAHEASQLGDCFLRCYTSASGSLLELHIHAPRFTTNLSDWPTASPLARWQAQHGARVTNLRHEEVTLTEFDRYLLPLLDGTRDRETLAAELRVVVDAGKLNVAQHGVPVRDEERLREILRTAVGEQLPRIATAALLLS